MSNPKPLPTDPEVIENVNPAPGEPAMAVQVDGMHVVPLIEEEAKAFRVREGYVRMTHPVTGGSSTVRQQAFDEVWSDKGWVLADGQKTSEPTE